MDATNMEHIPEDCFDIIIDKALLDTLLCHENNLHKVEDYLFEIFRVLKSTGTFICSLWKVIFFPNLLSFAINLSINELIYFD